MKKINRRAQQRQLQLPPGSLGWPYIGETLQLYSQCPNYFFKSRLQRYGEVFKTHLLGYPCVMLATAEAIRFVLVTHSDLFKPTYPKSKECIVGPLALPFQSGEYHLRLKKIVQGSLSPDLLRAILTDIESIVRCTLKAWDGHVEPTYHAMKRARKRLSCILYEIIEKRRQKGQAGNDLLGCLMGSKEENRGTLTTEQIADNVIGVLFAAQDTTASALTWILKYLHDNPNVLDIVKAEQIEIYQANDCGKKPLTWTQTRNMNATNKVMMESLRMASILPFTFREAVADVEYKGADCHVTLGYLIPKGWKVMPLFRNIHHNPEFFQDPDKFNPSRFEVAPRPNTFLPFGNGVHACPGNELAKIEILVLIYHLVTNYRWDLIESSDEVEYSPFAVPKRGLPAKIWRL
ncbi:hypothetical protein LUZ61_008756 [Rhynchospora tenuis]|uniref:Uncharacterized protein n=1 Tax=Rhynchospora tenuis TaxID=198213 RepID=A0AAD5ZVY5_9POAL|nr:hypothetical protein LUZ61_008756 [Rhynchospora tenuis]